MNQKRSSKRKRNMASFHEGHTHTHTHTHTHCTHTHTHTHTHFAQMYTRSLTRPYLLCGSVFETKRSVNVVARHLLLDGCDLKQPICSLRQANKQTSKQAAAAAGEILEQVRFEEQQLKTASTQKHTKTHAHKNTHKHTKAHAHTKAHTSSLALEQSMKRSTHCFV